MSVKREKLDRLAASAQTVIRRNAGLRVNGKVASNRTQEYSEQVMSESCRRLHRLGYYLEDVEGLQRKHVDALVQDWYAEGKGLTPKTIQNQFSRLKIFCGWLGKPGIISSSGAIGHLPGVAPETLKVKTFTETSKSWSGNGLDVVAVIRNASTKDKRAWAMLLLGLSFGLRKKEMLRIKPWKADAGNELRIDGSVAKNGRPRSIPINMDTPYGQFQRWCLDQAKGACKRSETLGWPELSIKQSENRFYHIMKMLGVTKIDSGISAHGLRAEFAENMALIRGLVPPSLGGAIDQMPTAQRKEISHGVSVLLGHDKPHTIGAYYSTFRPLAPVDGLGGRVGPIIPVDLERGIFASLYSNPCPVKGPDGYRQQTESERKQTIISVVVEKPWQEDQRIGVVDFVKGHPELEQKIRETLVAVGLGT